MALEKWSARLQKFTVGESTEEKSGCSLKLIADEEMSSVDGVQRDVLHGKTGSLALKQGARGVSLGVCDFIVERDYSSQKVYLRAKTVKPFSREEMNELNSLMGVELDVAFKESAKTKDAFDGDGGDGDEDSGEEDAAPRRGRKKAGAAA